VKAQNVLECGSSLPLSIRIEGNGWTVGKIGEQLADLAKSAGGMARSKTWRSLVTALCFLAAPLWSHAQSLSIDWFTIAGGGGTSAGGVFAVSGTIGQSDASAQPMTGENFSLVGGFWSLLAVQTPGAPLLTLRLTAPNTVVVSWPSPSTGFTLQQNTDLRSTNWVTAPQSVSDNGTTRFIFVNPSGNCFYRLFKP